jgi:hypothetical protein
MTDDKTQTDSTCRTEQAEPKQSGEDAHQQRHSGVPDGTQQGRSSAPGRKPLFRS